VDHPPIVFAFPQPGWPIQAEQGGSATGEGGIRMTVFASTRPVDGPCPALGPGIAYVLFTMEPR
jgi:hypothetical protein